MLGHKIGICYFLTLFSLEFGVLAGLQYFIMFFPVLICLGFLWYLIVLLWPVVYFDSKCSGVVIWFNSANFNFVKALDPFDSFCSYWYLFHLCCFFAACNDGDLNIVSVSDRGCLVCGMFIIIAIVGLFGIGAGLCYHTWLLCFALVSFMDEFIDDFSICVGGRMGVG